MAIVSPAINTGLLLNPTTTTATPTTTAPATPTTGTIKSLIPTQSSTISKEAQDISKATGTAYEGIATGALAQKGDWADYDSAAASLDVDKTAAIKSGTSYIDQAKNTVAGQLSSLLSSDSPYIKQAEQKAKEYASSRGLLNTSIAAQAGRAAAYEAALPIATSDAETYNKFGLQQQSAENAQSQTETEAIISSYLNKQTADIKQTSQNIQNAFQSRLQGADQQTKVFLQDFQQKHATALQDLIGDQNAFLQSTQISADKAQTVYAQAGEYVKNYQIAIENMMTDPDFLDQGETNINNAINQLQILTRNSIKFVGASAGLNMTAYSNLVDNYFKPLGFTTKQPTVTATA